MQSETDSIYETPQVDEEELALMDRAFFDKIAVDSGKTKSTWWGIVPVLVFLVVTFVAILFFVLKRYMVKKTTT